MIISDLQHWYCFTFFGYHLNSNDTCTASVYVGYPEKNEITFARIQSAKNGALVKDNATLTSLSYLGCMTKDEFRPDWKEYEESIN